MTLHEILPTVTRPARYIGNELHAVKKENPSLKVALVYPDVYERGMSQYSTRLLYHLLNREEGVLCERVFAPWKDMKERLIQEGLPLFSLESQIPLGSFHLILFLLNDPLSYTTILDLLNLSEIPLKSIDRSHGFPLILGGGECSANPEPIAPFFDGFWIGDPEEIVPHIVKKVKELGLENGEGGTRKDELISNLSKIEGIHIPSTIDRQEIVQFRVINSLCKEDAPTGPIVPYIEIDRDSLFMEIERRKIQRTVSDVIDLVMDSFEKTGWEEVAFLSASELPDGGQAFMSVLKSLSTFFEESHVILHLPLLQPQSLSEEGMRAIKDVQKGILRLDVDGVNSENSNMNEEIILQTVDCALQNGFSRIYLQTLLGSSDKELEEVKIKRITQLFRKARKVSGPNRSNRSIQLFIAPYIPKPHSREERRPLLDLDEYQGNERLLKEKLRDQNIIVKFPKGEETFIRGLLYRGDRTYSKVIEGVYRSGGSLETWSENFSLKRWTDSINEIGMNPQLEAKRWVNSEELPWNYILSPKESNQSGVQRVETERSKDSTGSRLNYHWGRQKRRVSVLSPFSKLKLRVCFSKGEEVKYLSHLDLIRTIHRALRRAKIPVAYSRGFIEREKVVFGAYLQRI
jgi:hypothetical protein